jgi:hypothetical protein
MLLVVAAGLVLAATGGAGNSSRPTYSARDLPGIVDVKPRVPKWSFDAGDSYISGLAHAPAFTLREWLGDSPSQRALAAKLKKAGFVIGGHRAWSGETKQGNGAAAGDAVFALLFRDAPGASAAFQALRLVWPGKGAKIVPAKGLGQESQGVHEPDVERAFYLWRRANLVIVAEMTCDGLCDEFRVVPPARTYADEIDARAKRKA